MRALERLTELVVRFAAAASSAAAGGGEPAEAHDLPRPMTVADGTVRNRAGHAPPGLNGRDFPWPGWPQAPLPKNEATIQKWQPFAPPLIHSA
jgi:hypothetical protein